MLLAYFGPETLLPVTSVIAGIVGVFLMFGRNAVRLLLLPLRRLRGQRPSTPQTTLPSSPAATRGSALQRRRAQAAARQAASGQEGSDH